MKLKTNIGASVKAKREELKLRQVDVAKLAGMSQGQLAAIEHVGDKADCMQLRTAARVATALRVDLRFFQE